MNPFPWLKRFFEDASSVPDEIRLLLIVGGISFCILAAYDVVINHAHFDLVLFGTGFAAILGGGGAGIRVRKDQ